MNKHGFDGYKEMLLTCVEVLRRREAELGAPRDDGPSAEELAALVASMDQMSGGTGAAVTVPEVLRLHAQLAKISNQWLFPELDPVAKLLIPYFDKTEYDLRTWLSQDYPTMAASLQKIASLGVAERVASRRDIERGERRARIRRYFSKLFGRG